MTQPLRLAIFHDETSASVFEIAQAARTVCQILWVVGWSSDEPPVRMLSRFGEVVDLTGMHEIQAIEHVVSLLPDGVIVFNELPLKFAAAVADRLGVPFHSPRTAELLTDKLAQRMALQQAGLPVPAFAAVQLDKIESSVPFPAVLKPREGAGGRDTFRVENLIDVADSLAKCNPNEAFILEEWLPDRTMQPSLAADLVSVESFAHEGVIEHIMVTGRFPFAPPFRETGLFLPSDLEPADKEAVIALVDTAVKAIQVRHGFLHTEVKMTPVGPRLIEINGRLGGGVSGMIVRIGGPSLLLWAIKLALGQEVGPIPNFIGSPVAFYRFILAPLSATRVETVRGIDKLSELPGVDKVSLNRPRGALVDAQKSSHEDYVIRIDGVVPSHADLTSLVHEQIESTLQLTWNFDD